MTPGASHRLTKTQFSLLDFLVANGGVATISAGSRTFRTGFDRVTREPMAVCNEVSLYFLLRWGWIVRHPGNLPSAYRITMQGRIARCRHTYRTRKRRGPVRHRGVASSPADLS
jgi:hypothetical protein